MDGMILYLTQGLTRARTTNLRILSAAFVASCIVPISVLMPGIWLTTSLGKIAFSLLIVTIAFAYVSLRTAFVQWLTFYFVTFAIGGTMVGVHYFFNSQIAAQGGEWITYSTGYGHPVSWLFVCIGFPASWIFTKWRLEQIHAHRLKAEDLYQVKVVYLGKSILCTGLVDSGNHLVDPISKKMVFLADLNVWKQFFSEEELKGLKTETVLDRIEEVSERYHKSLHLVPFQGAGASSNLMVTFMVDNITIYTPEGELTIEQPLLGIQHHDLTHDQMYQIIIHPHAAIKGISA